MDIQPLPTTPRQTPNVESELSELGQDVAKVEEAFESELLSWLASAELEDSESEPGLTEAELIDEPIFTSAGELAGSLPVGLDKLPLEGGPKNPSSADKSATPKLVVPSSAPARLTEEQLNVRKLVDYLKGLERAPSGTSASIEIKPAEQTVAEHTAAESTLPAVEGEANLELDLDIEEPVETEVDESEAELELGSSGLSEGGDGRRGLGRHAAQALAEAQAASAQRAQETQLSQASRRMMAELRERMTNRNASRLPLNLVLEEAAVPMRLRFQPVAGGAHEVAFVVNNMRARQELRKLMPEIETVLTELPVEVADVRIEIEPRLERRAQEKRR